MNRSLQQAGSDFVVVLAKTGVETELVNLLEYLGLSVRSAGDLSRLFETVAFEKTAAAILDWEACDQDSLLATARRLWSERGVPVIFAMPEEAEAAIHVNLDPTFGRVFKPFTDRELRAALEMARWARGLRRERKDAENTLRTAAKEQEMILEATREVVVLYDRDLRIKWANRAAYEWHCVELKDILGKHCYEIWRGLAEPCENCPVIKARDTGEVFQSEANNPAGRVLLQRGYPVFDENRQVTGMIELALDVTDLEQTRSALRDNEQKYRQMIDQAPEDLLLMNLDGRIVEANERACQSLGYSRGEILNLRLDEVETEFNIEALKQQWQTLRSGRTNNLEGLHRRKDGTTYPIEAQVGQIHFGGQDYILGFSRDITKRKQAEKMLRLMQFSLEKSAFGIAWFTPEGKIIYANEAICRRLGYSREEMIGKHLYDYVEGLTPENRIPRWEKLKKIGHDSFESRHRTRDGRIIPIQTNTHYLVFEGQEYGFSFTEDISERKKAEEMLRLMGTSVEKSKLGVVWHTPEGKVIFANEAMSKRLGYSREELVGMHLWDYVAGHAPDQFRERWQQLKREGSRTFESLHRTKGGRMISVQANTHYLVFEGKEYGFSYTEDISERKKAEELMRMMRYSLDASTIGIFWLTLDGRYIYANKAACRELGYGRDELIGMHVSQINPDWTEDLRRRNIAIRRSFGGQTFEVSHRRKDGSVFLAEVTSTILDFEGQEYEFSFFHDITERKKAEEVLRLAQFSLESISSAILWLDPEGHILYVNEAACRSLEYSRDELMNIRLEDFVLDWSVEFRRKNWEIRKSLGRQVIELLFKTKSGRVFPVEVTSHYFQFEGTEYDFSLIVDITERKKAEEKLRLMEFSLESSTVETMWWSLDGRCLFANQAACVNLGYSREELIGMHVSQIDADWSEDKRHENIEQRRRRGGQRFETYHRRKNGSIFPVEVSTQHLKFEGLEYEFSFVQNITERKKAEETLRLMQFSLESTSAGVFWLDPAARFVYVNEAACRNLGYSRDELLTMGVSDIDPDWSIERRQKNWAIRRKFGRQTIETRHRTKDGRIFPVEITSHYFKFEGKEYDFAFAVDISERKKSEELLRMMRFSLESTLVGIFWRSLDGYCLYANEAACRSLGYTREELIGTHVSQTDPDYSEERRRRNIGIRRKEGTQTFETRHRRKDGTIYPAEVTAQNMIFEGMEYEFTFFQDITERKKADELLRMMQFSLESSTVGIFWRSMDGRCIYANQAASQSLGYTQKELIGMHVSQLNVGWTEEKRQKNIEIRRLKGSQIFETRHRRKDGSIYPAVVTASNLIFEGREIEFSFFQDITKRKQAEEKNRLLRFSLDASTVMVHWINEAGEILFVNDAGCRAYGYSREELIGMHISELVVGFRTEMNRLMWEQRKQIRRRQFEARHRTRDGREFPVEVTTHFLEFEGREYEFSFIQDITERKKAEEELRLTQFSLDSSSITVLWLNEAGDLLYVNDAACMAYGYSREELLKMHLSEIVVDFDLDRRQRNWRRRKLKAVWTFESLHLRRDGNLFPVEVTSHYFEFGDMEYEFSFVQNITDRKKAEQELQSHTAFLEALFDAIPSGVFYKGLDGRYLGCNPAYEAFAGRRRDEIIGRSLGDVWSEPVASLYNESDAELLKTPGSQQYEQILTTPDGQRRHIVVSKSTYNNAEGDTAGIVGVVTDITEQKANEEKLRVALTEREFLLREIHHRVKNNMQVVSSLLNLQIGKESNAQAVEAMRESQGRVVAMALVHECLYRSDSLAQVDLEDYLRGLAHRLAESYAVTGRKPRISIQARERVRLGIERAVPCGLVLNELIANSLKHAFPDGRTGQIFIIVGLTPDGRAEVVIRDDGVGLPANLDWRQSGTLGMFLVTNLVELQLSGEIELERGNGTAFTIRFEP